MLIPIRCFTCGNILADKELAYHAMVRAHEKNATETETETELETETETELETTAPATAPEARSASLPFMEDLGQLLAQPEMKSVHGQVLDQLGVTKMCCRLRMLSAVDVLEDI